MMRTRRNQDRLGRDCLDVDIASAGTSAASDVFVGLQDVPTRLNKQQLTSTEYALQEIRFVIAYSTPLRINVP